MGDYMPELLTIAHVSLTVSDLDRSIAWYERVFDAKLVLDDTVSAFRRAALIVAGQAVIGLQDFPDPADDLPFNERRVGLDHLAFACSSRREVDAWKARLDELGVVNGGVVDAGYGFVLSFRDPDNIALEFFALPS
jgi:glyoxylase I family protein